MSILSLSYFNAAEELRQLAWQDNKSGGFVYSRHTYTAIIMFTTALEVFINENLEQHYSTLCKEKIMEFVSSYLPETNFKKCVWYDNVLALATIRNELIHYKPVLRARGTAPGDIVDAMKKSKVPLFQPADYISNLGNPAFADWAHAYVKEFGKQVSKDWHLTRNTLKSYEEHTAAFEASVERTRALPTS